MRGEGVLHADSKRTAHYIYTLVSDTILRANVSFIVERLPFASAEGTQAALRRTHARARVFRESDPATVPYDHYRSRERPGLLARHHPLPLKSGQGAVRPMKTQDRGVCGTRRPARSRLQYAQYAPDAR